MKKLQIICSIIFISIPMVSLNHVVAANTFFISTKGNDSNSGTIHSPWATLNYAVDQTQPGDTILIRGGNYDEGKFFINTGGANGLFLTIKPYPGEKVIYGSEQSEARIGVEASYVRIEGIHLINTKLRTNHKGEHHHIQFVNNYLKGDNSMGAIEFTGNDGLIEGNIIECDNKVNTHSHGIYLHFGKNNIVRNNYVSNAPYYGIHVYDERKSYDSPAVVRRYENILIENNIVTYSRERAGIIISAGESEGKGIEIDGIVVRNNILFKNGSDGITISYYGRIRNVDIYNNVIYGNNRNGIELNAHNVDQVMIKNNIFDSNGSGHIDVSSRMSHIVISHNLYHQPASISIGVADSNPIYGDPLFINPAEKNFHIKAGSPAIDAGVTVGLPYKGKAPDIGAFECK